MFTRVNGWQFWLIQLALGSEDHRGNHNKNKNNTSSNNNNHIGSNNNNSASGGCDGPSGARDRKLELESRERALELLSTALFHRVLGVTGGITGELVY